MSARSTHIDTGRKTALYESDLAKSARMQQGAEWHEAQAQRHPVGSQKAVYHRQQARKCEKWAQYYQFESKQYDLFSQNVYWWAS